jgi:hypothetical protein
MPQEIPERHEIDVVAPPHARLVARTDGAGTLVRIVAVDPAEASAAIAANDATAGSAPEARLALSVDLVAAALARLGELRSVGNLRSALLTFDGAVMAIGRDENDRSLVVIGDANATPGLVLSHLYRALAKNGAPPEGR